MKNNHSNQFDANWHKLHNWIKSEFEHQKNKFERIYVDFTETEIIFSKGFLMFPVEFVAKFQKPDMLSPDFDPGKMIPIEQKQPDR